MKFTTFAGLFIAACAAVSVAMLASHRPGGTPTALPTPPSGPPTTWPDYSINGPGFVAPSGPDGAAIAYGYKLVTQTYAVIGPEVADASRRFAGNNLACQNCHLDGGTNRAALPLVGIFKTYPKFSTRSGRTVSLVERVDECMTRSMNGRKLPDGSPEMAGTLAYLRFIGEPAPVTIAAAPAAALPADSLRGAMVFGRVCAACHQRDGLGRRRGSSSVALGYEFPPLWGPDSFNDGAGMDRFERAVSFIQHNMPRGTEPSKPQLTLQEAWDVAALLQIEPRPHYVAAP